MKLSTICKFIRRQMCKPLDNYTKADLIGGAGFFSSAMNLGAHYTRTCFLVSNCHMKFRTQMSAQENIAV